MSQIHAATTTLSLWDQKPRWCQPWSILLSGVVVIVLSWLLFRMWWISALMAVGVLIWWVLFLVLVPRAWKQAMLENSSRQDDQSP